jgi:hypothetical protein
LREKEKTLKKADIEIAKLNSIVQKLQNSQVTCFHSREFFLDDRCTIGAISALELTHS